MLQPRIPCAKNKPVLGVALRFALRLASILRLVWVLIFIGFAALATGYLALGDYIAHQIVRTAMVVTLVFLVYHLLDAMVQAIWEEGSGA